MSHTIKYEQKIIIYKAIARLAQTVQTVENK